MTAGQAARMNLGQSGEGCKHGWVSLAGGSRALRLAGRNRRMAWAGGSKREKARLDSIQVHEFDWLYISLHVQKPKVFTTTWLHWRWVASYPRVAWGGSWTSSRQNCLLGASGVAVRRPRPHLALCLHPARSPAICLQACWLLCMYLGTIC